MFVICQTFNSKSGNLSFEVLYYAFANLSFLTAAKSLSYMHTDATTPNTVWFARG